MSCQAARTGDVLLAPPRRLLSQTQPPRLAAPSSTEPRLNKTLARHNLGHLQALHTHAHVHAGRAGCSSVAFVHIVGLKSRAMSHAMSYCQRCSVLPLTQGGTLVQGAVETRNANCAQITANLAFKRGNGVEEVQHGGGGGREMKHAGSGNRMEVAEAEGQNPALQDEAEMQVSMWPGTAALQLQRSRAAPWADTLLTGPSELRFMSPV